MELITYEKIVSQYYTRFIELIYTDSTNFKNITESLSIVSNNYSKYIMYHYNFLFLQLNIIILNMSNIFDMPTSIDIYLET